MMMTPLLVAAEFSSTESFKYLFSLEKCEKNVFNQMERTCLHLASKAGCTSIIDVTIFN